MHAFVVLGLVRFPYQAKRFGETCLKWAILCRVGRKTTTQSINQLPIDIRMPGLLSDLTSYYYYAAFNAHCIGHFLFCSSAVLDPRVGHTMDVLSPFISVLCHSDWLFHESCPRLDVHPGRAWSSLPTFTAVSVMRMMNRRWLSIILCCISVTCFQCFDAVGWVAGRASGL